MSATMQADHRGNFELVVDVAEQLVTQQGFDFATAERWPCQCSPDCDLEMADRPSLAELASVQAGQVLGDFL